MDSIDDVFYMPDDNHHWDLPQTLERLARTPGDIIMHRVNYGSP